MFQVQPLRMLNLNNFVAHFRVTVKIFWVLRQVKRQHLESYNNLAQHSIFSKSLHPNVQYNVYAKAKKLVSSDPPSTSWMTKWRIFFLRIKYFPNYLNFPPAAPCNSKFKSFSTSPWGVQQYLNLYKLDQRAEYKV